MERVFRLMFVVMLWAGCAFERSPVRQPLPTGGTRPDLPIVVDSGVTAPIFDAAVPPDTSIGEAPVPEPDASIPVDVDAGDISDDDAGPKTPTKPTPQPTQCGNVFCPLVDAPAKACCTAATDVASRRAFTAGLCGLDLQGLNSPLYGDGCWQRDRLGIVDDRCPNQGEEPGCCGDDGLCGTHAGEQPLGCRHAPGSAVRACDEAPPVTTCDPTGTYALRISVDSTWDGREGGLASLTDDGRGLIRIYILVDVQHVDPDTKEVTVDGRVCGVTLPPFYSSTLCESYLPVFPDTLWESPNLPRPIIDGRYECGTQGCVLSLGPVTYLFGIHMDNPEASWPTARETPMLRCSSQPRAQCFPDHDGDGAPGVMVRLETMGDAPAASNGSRCGNGYKYRAAPLSESIAAIFNGVRRSDRLQLGIRARVGGSMRFGDDCQSAKGSALAQYVNSRARGCMIAPGTFDVLRTRPAGPNESCDTNEARFVDESMPEYRVLGPGERPTSSAMRTDTRPSAGPVIDTVRFGPTGLPVSCQQVREAAY